MKGMLFAVVFAACAAVPAYAADAGAPPVATAPAAAPAAPAAAAPAVPVATDAKPAGSQQQKMKDCNADAGSKGLKGDDRKAFMKTCLSKDGAPAAAPVKTTQQQKMKDCNAEAKTKALKGDDRKTFMSTCLKG